MNLLLTVVKSVVNLVSSVSVGMVTRNVINGAVVAATGPVNGVLVAVGAALISSTVSEIVAKSVDRKIDDFAENVSNINNVVNMKM